MRRSAAPSQQLAGSAAKRPRFVPPVKVNNTGSHVAVGNVTATLKPKNDNVCSEAFERSGRGDLKSTGEVEAAQPVTVTQKSAVAAVSRFRPPTGSIF